MKINKLSCLIFVCMALSINACKVPINSLGEQGYGYPWVNPLNELVGVSVYPDTSFSFHSTDSLPFQPIELTLPDSLFGSDLIGSARVFVDFIDSGLIDSVLFYSYELQRKKKVVATYHIALKRNKTEKPDAILEQYIIKKINELPVRKTVNQLEVGTYYRAYCSLRLVSKGI